MLQDARSNHNLVLQAKAFWRLAVFRGLFGPLYNSRCNLSLDLDQILSFHRYSRACIVAATLRRCLL